MNLPSAEGRRDVKADHREESVLKVKGGVELCIRPGYFRGGVWGGVKSMVNEGFVLNG